jgi:formate-dependent phosphoribosylglycinamide formyltransferase (GAR transformylase)
VSSRLWFLNFDADDELSRPSGYRTPRAVLARFAELALRVEGLVPVGDRVVAEWLGATEAVRTANSDELVEGRAFCPTPRALAALRREGATPVRAPSLEVLRQVNHRAFCANLGQTLPDARFVRTRAELEATLSRRGGPWILKRAFGYAGKGRALLRDGALEDWSMAFARVSLENGEGLQVEPWVDRRLDVGLHGFLSQRGELMLGDPTRVTVDARGTWQKSEILGGDHLSASDRDALSVEAHRVAAALAGAGYFGPFGIDAFTFADERGATRFNPRSEINARYSMGWAIGMGSRRPDLRSESIA